MKKLLIIMFALIVLASCTKEGEIVNQSMRHIIINGKEYRFIKIVPSDGQAGVWILVPNDASVEVPQVISYTVRQGKRNEQVSVIQVNR